ncbi:hypothetical protein ACC716_08630 [Rhizobium johnstonii]|uniref:hypothetical protein n=1 Tax=Rhizobium TaxID=379 RepID=UPI00102F9CE8|nr:hypothetical protein [Rhizobium leguminosarum]TBH48345.1 hypothetical protein ELG62_31635 [Rhizobium leguminosarum]
MLLLVALPLSTYPSAARSADLSKAADLGSRLGLGGAKLWMDHKTITIPPSTLPLDQQNQKVNSALERYQQLKNGYAGVSTAAGGVKLGVSVAIGAAVLYGGPQAAVTVPLTLLATASTISLDLMNNRVEAVGKQRSRELLVTMQDDLVKEAGVADFRALAKDPALLRSTIIKSNALLNDVKSRATASGDPDLVGMAADALVQASQETDITLIDAVAHNATEISSVKKGFDNFVLEMKASNERIEARLDDQGEQIASLGAAVGDLTKDVKNVQEQVTKMGKNQDLIADFMFSSMSPGEKVSALRGGLMDDRLQCPPGQVGCDTGAIKAALIERFDSEAVVNQRIATAGQILKGINDISTITSNLGIDLGADGNKAVEIASTAVNAYIGFMAGDYLGSVAALTGMFGKKPDPDAERFKIMMGYLKQQFEVVNQKLDAILKNQQTILDAVAGLSQQLQQTYEALDGRLDQMQVEQSRISSNVKALIWDDWKSCYSVYTYALAPNPADAQAAYVETSTLRFSTIDNARNVIDGRAREVSDCISVVRNAMSSMTATRWFGSFLDADRMMDPDRLPDPNTLSAAVKDETNRWRDLQRLYKENVYAPSFLISNAYAQRHGISRSSLLFLNASLVSDGSQLAALLKWIDAKNSFSCTSSEDSTRAIRGLVCLPGTDPDNLASDITSTMLSTDILLDVADWMTVVGQLADLYNENDRKFARSIEEVATLPKVSPGKEIIRKLVDMFTLAIAYNNRMHGGLTAFAVAEDMRDNRTDANHVRLLANDPYLAENAMNLYLHFTAEQAKELVVPSFSDRYAQAFLYAKANGEDRFEPLYALFGRKFDFAISEDGRPEMIVKVGQQSVRAALPAPERFADITFVFPPRYNALVGTRQRLIERYLDYQFGADAELAEIVLQR